MTKVLFYELENQSVEAVLASLLERCIERDWRAAVEVTSAERLESLDTYLWTYRDEAFLAHGSVATGCPELQPVFISETCENQNNASVRFLVDGAEIGDISTYDRAVYLFDVKNTDERERARAQWREASSAGHDVTYWKQDANGCWIKNE